MFQLHLMVKSVIIYIKQWPQANKLCLHLSKTKEIVFLRPHPCNCLYHLNYVILNMFNLLNYWASVSLKNCDNRAQWTPIHNC